MGWNPLDPLTDLADAAGDAINDVAAVVEPAWESGVETLGELADDGLDLLAEGAELVGLDGAAEALDDFGDQISSALGGELEERQLGETQDPKELVRGEPEAIGESASTLADMAAAVELTGQGLRSIDGGDWTGEGRAGFDAAFDPQPQLWFDAADAFTDAANTLVEWGYAVETAQRGAADAITEWNAAIAEENRQKSWWNSLPARTRAETPLVDTWSSRYRAALDILERARTNRNAAAEQAGAAIADATETAPTEPPFTSRMGANIEDGIAISQYAGLSFVDGLLTGLSGIVQFVRQVNPADPYNVTHPADYLANLSTLGTGIVVLASDPAAAVDAVVNQARTSPFEFTGMLTSEVLLTVATGGAGAARTPLSLLNRVRHALPGRGVPGRGLPDVDLPGPAGRPGAGPPDGPPARAGLGDRPGGPEPTVDTRAPAPDAGSAGSAGPQADRPGSAGPEPSIDAGPPDRPDPEPQEQAGAAGAGAPDSAPPVDRTPDAGGDGPGARPQEPAPEPAPERPGGGDPNGPGTAGPGNDPPDPRPDTYTPPDRSDIDAGPGRPTASPEPDAPATRPDAEPPAVRPADADTPAARPSPDTSPTRADGDSPAPRPDSDSRVDTDPPPGRVDSETPDAGSPRDRTDADLPHDRTDADLPHDRTDTDLPHDRTDGESPRDRTDTDTPHRDSDTAGRPDADSRGDRPAARADSDPDAQRPDTPRPRADTDTAETTRSGSPDQGPVAPHSPGTHPNSQSSTTPSPARPDAPAPRPTPELPDTPRRPDPVNPRPDPDRPRADPDRPRAGLDPTSPRRPEITTDTNRPAVDTRPVTPDSPATRSPEPDPPGDSTPMEQRADTDTGIGDEARSGDPANDRDPSQTTACGDPVDVATGEFLLPTVDLDLPGVLPLTLNRRHRSNYRWGRWFGRTWSTTLDIRLIVDRDGIVFAGEDGILLAYPHPQPGAPVRPLSGGSRSTCTRTETGSYRVHDPEREITWHFAPESPLRGADERRGNYAISAITDRHRNRIRFHYDPDGAPTAITHSGGYRVRVDTDPRLGRITALALHGGDADVIVIRRFDYEAGDLVAVTEAMGATSRFTYDADGRILSWTDSRGTSMSNTYDHRGRVVAQHGTHGILSATFAYRDHPGGTGSTTLHTDSLGAATSYGFDSDLRLRDLRSPTGAHTRIDYNSDRKPLTVTGPDGAVTRYLYTTDGDPARIERPDGTAVDLAYAEPGRQSRITGPDGAVTQQDGTATAPWPPPSIRPGPARSTPTTPAAPWPRSPRPMAPAPGSRPTRPDCRSPSSTRSTASPVSAATGSADRPRSPTRSVAAPATGGRRRARCCPGPTPTGTARPGSTTGRRHPPGT
ncbi:putative T7SS-secreted protein [Nocardia harenae]|uniref:putative T7SS-secreted protein n=1 Tax=Nocardia harenae TaxID=358707 RepID=UPI00082BE66D|nr:DUF6531 domain-containing protein [Nocardia harenae]